MTLEDKVRSLIAKPESDIMDFKQIAYDPKKEQLSLTKDIVAMANTPRDGSAHIVLGVGWSPETGSIVTGLEHQIDDAVLQQAFHSRINPRPEFVCKPCRLDGKLVAVIEIPVSQDGPYMASVDLGAMHTGTVYYRQGSRNSPATGAKSVAIYSWFRGESSVAPADYQPFTWQRLLTVTQNFDPAHTLLLAVDTVNEKESAQVDAIGLLPLKIVFDFDPNSDSQGLLSRISTTLGSHRSIHRAVKGQYHIQPDPGTHWFFARGLSGRQESLATSSHRDWLKAYKQELSIQLDSIAKSIGPTPVTLLAIWSQVDLSKHLRTLLEEVYGKFHDALTMVLVSEDAGSFQTIADDYGATAVHISLRSLCYGLVSHFSNQGRSSSDACIIPSSSGSPVSISADDQLWFQESLDILYKDIGITEEDDERRYRLGGDISYRNLHLHHDCDRDATPAIGGQVESDLKSRSAVRVNVYHSPGSGGSSIALRVAWDLHRQYPVALIRKSAPEDAASRLAKISALTESSVLAVVDGSIFSESTVDDLYDLLCANQTPVVILQVLRRFQPQTPGKRQFWISSKLSDAEADRFRDAYGKAVPAKARALASLAQSRASERNAFFFGLTAFGEDFKGLGSYVKARISGLTQDQSRVLGLVSIAHYYGQQHIPIQGLAAPLGFPQTRSLQMEGVFSQQAAHALELFAFQNGRKRIRMIHQLVALEVMRRLFSSGEYHEQVDGAWHQALSEQGKDFADFCYQAAGDSGALLDTVRRVFIYRDNSDVLGTERAGSTLFSQFLEDIPSSHGKIDLLQHLTKCFPGEAHFHAHLGRALGLIGDFDRAILSVDEALRLEPSDHVLHHMRGMIFRNKIRSGLVQDQTVELLVQLAKEAASSFEESRHHQPDTVHGYISEIQMLIDVLDRAQQMFPGRSNPMFSSNIDPFLRNSLERAENLLDHVNHLFVGESPSTYVLDCRAKVQSLYGDYSAALQDWDNLMGRPGVEKSPIRRQIVWTILRRKEGKWDALDRREINRVQMLLETNLQEESDKSTSLRLWLRAIRHANDPPSLDSVIERVSYWKLNTASLDAVYYLYVLHMLRGVQGSSQGISDGELALEECRAVARFRRDRTRSFEWIGSGIGVKALVHQSRLGDWADGFWSECSLLVGIDGRVASIDAPQKGVVELDCGIKAFFVPAKAGLSSARDENARVTLNLGFSYDGPRAWNVKVL